MFDYRDRPPPRYSEMLPEFQTPIRGLYVANLSQIYPEDRGTNYSVRLADQVVGQIEKDGLLQ